MNGWNVRCRKQKCREAYLRMLPCCPHCGLRNHLKRIRKRVLDSL